MFLIAQVAYSQPSKSKAVEKQPNRVIILVDDMSLFGFGYIWQLNKDAAHVCTA
jgi:hypothetical protein